MINHNLNIMGHAITAAQEIHTAMCLFPDDHRGQSTLIDALHSVLIVIEESRQEMQDRPKREKAIADEVRKKYVTEEEEPNA